MKNYYVYILSVESNNRTYIGITNNLERRIYEHKTAIIESYTRKYNIKKLVYYEIFNDINYAIHREKRLKKWYRKWKIELINSKNPQWLDLSDEYGNVMDFRMIE